MSQLLISLNGIDERVLKKNINELESRLDAIHLLEEATPKNNANIASYGELLSSKIIHGIFHYNEIESELAGTIVKILVDDASPVEFDQPLFVIKPS